MLREIRDLGFEYAELSHGTRISLMPGILDAVDSGEIKISTLHNFCPLPMGITGSAPNVYKFSAERDRERESAIKHTLKTLDFAVRVKAPVVVTHSGSIEMKDYTDKLLKMVGHKQRGTFKYLNLCDDFVHKRDSLKKEYFQRTIDTLKKMLPEVEKRGLKLGLENRQALEELPIESDYLELFRELNSAAAVYWHDTGHAQIKENLGFIHHGLHLESLQSHLAGFHIHDVQFPGDDHCQPGTGIINFAALKRLVKPKHIKVFEFSPKLTVEEVKAGVAHIKATWGEG